MNSFPSPRMIRFLTLLMTSCVLGSTCSAALIDFDTNPANGQSWTGDVVQLRGDEWQASHGVRFYYGPFFGDQYPEFVNIKEGVGPGGSGANAFNGSQGPDQVIPGDPAGGYFISSDVIINGGIPQRFTIDFDNNQSYVSMGILDIDLGEDWQIDAIGSSGQILETQFLLTEQAPGDARSRFFEFDRTFSDIAEVHISYASTHVPVDFAFDNLVFASTPIPEPASLSLICLIGGGFFYRQQTRKTIC